MNVLLTGGAGYIGSHVVRALQAAGCKCVVVNFARWPSLAAAFETIRHDQIPPAKPTAMSPFRINFYQALAVARIIVYARPEIILGARSHVRSNRITVNIPQH